jgi:hypothetical protein
MPKEIKPLKPPPLPAKLPFEDSLDKLLNNLAKKAYDNPAVLKLKQVQEQMPYVAETEFPTPFGTIKTPELGLPKVVPPEIDERRREAVKSAIAVDLSGIAALIPAVGDVIADVIEDTYGAKIKDTLTPEEFNLYTKYDKVGPSTLAMLRALLKR